MNSDFIAKKSDIEIVVAKLYVFCLPIAMISPLLSFTSIFHGAARSLAFIFHILGLMIYVYKSKGLLCFKRDETSSISDLFYIVIILLNISSIIMACIIQMIEGNYAGESAFSGVSGMIVYYFQYAFILYYNKHVFEILGCDEIKRILKKLTIFLLILGYFQAGRLVIGNPFKIVLEKIDIFGILLPNKNMWKLTLTGSEGATAGGIFGILVFPYLLTEFIRNNNKYSLFQCFLWIPILILMRSSTAYLMVIADLSVFFILFLSKNKKKYACIFSVFILILICFSLYLLSGNIDFVRKIFPSDISYLIFEKMFDLENGSTVSRVVPFITNWKIFLEYPLFGVGNGLQGYYYIKCFPEWAKNIAGSDVMTFYRTANTEIVNGGIFFPGYLSGYGLFGIFLLIAFLSRYIKRINIWKQRNSFFCTYFLIAIASVIVCGFQGELAGNYYVWFIISLPMIKMLEMDDTLNE